MEGKFLSKGWLAVKGWLVALLFFAFSPGAVAKQLCRRAGGGVNFGLFLWGTAFGTGEASKFS